MAVNLKVIFIGSGNVATHLSMAIANAGFQILGFYSRNKETALQLAKKHQALGGGIEDIKTDAADLIIISVPDQAIKNVLTIIPETNALIVHTSGSIAMNVLAGKFVRIGVFYPLQTFSKKKNLDYSTIPLLLEVQQDYDMALLENLAHSITKKVYKIDSAKRKKIHIAAVFSSNFTNYLYHIAADLLSKDDIPFEVIQPLIAETVDKLKELHPYDAQTGPAVRNDRETIENHLQDLKEIPEYYEIYKLMSHHIIKSRKK